MKIAAVSDLHGYLPTIPDGVDVCLIAGDVGIAAFDDNNMPRLDVDAYWWANHFAPWCTELIQRHIFPVGVAGNHDFIAQKVPEFMEEFPWIYLEDSGTELLGLKIWGTPWQPNYCDWAFNAPPGPGGEAFLDEKFSLIPDDTDILIAHGPPAEFHDRLGSRNVGSKALKKHIARVGPKLCVYGHIHHGTGVDKYGDTIMANVSVTSVVDGHYVMDKEATIFEI